MTDRPGVLVVIGTRPEGIKLAPVVLALRAFPTLRVRLCVTGQHRDMLDPILAHFGLAPDHDLNLMEPGQTLTRLAGRMLLTLEPVLAAERPALVLVQGDTTTAFAATLAAFYQRIPVGHVEAGLRTGNLASPWPEEANRVMVSRLASLHFAPTEAAADNLRREGVPDAAIHTVGNSVVDALLLTVAQVQRDPPTVPGMPAGWRDSGRRLVLITGHRRENFGPGFAAICAAVADLAAAFPGVDFVYPVHGNPQVRHAVAEVLRPTRLANLHLIEPLPYREFVALFLHATLILTDSGGIQEEAPALGKPVLVMRDTTERPEAVAAGVVRLVGADRGRIVAATAELLTDAAAYRAMARVCHPYGDGHAGGRVAGVCAGFVKNPLRHL